MGTYFRVSFRPQQCALTQPQVVARLDSINVSMSTYLPNSEISRFNDHTDSRPVTVTEQFAEVFRVAQRVHQQTGGALDVSVGPLIELWGFGPTKLIGQQAPEQTALAAAEQAVGMELLVLKERQLQKLQAQVRLDFSALAKGFAVDQLTELGLASGCTDLMVDIGGEIRVSGKNSSGQLWRLGIEQPDANQIGQAQAVLAITDLAVATSGDYRNFRVVNGQRVDHVFDPRIPGPALSSVVSATVVHPTAIYADALATALMVLDVEEGLALAETLNLAVYLLYLDQDGQLQVAQSPAILPLME